MVIMKIGERYHIKKKNGEAGKTSFASRKAAENAQRNLKKLSAKKKTTKKKTTKKKTTKKKTTKKKSTKKKSSNKKGSGKTTKKRSWVGAARLGIYMLAASAEAIRLVGAYGFTKTAAVRISQSYTGRDFNGKPSTGAAIQTYGPLAGVAIVDTAASKLGVYRRMGSV